nr:PREDICTED: catenin alpha-3-like [Equus przewalskii]
MVLPAEDDGYFQGTKSLELQLTGKKERSNTLNIAIDNMCKKTRDLRRQLRKAIIDHVSDSFLDTTVPLLVLIEAAKNGREKEIKEYAAIFREHTSRLVEVANLACSMSANEDGIKIVKIAANHLETLCPQATLDSEGFPAFSSRGERSNSTFTLYQKLGIDR